MRIVLSVGGNALLKRAEAMSEEVQRRNIREAVRSMGRILNEHEVLITHGNGPQVGLLALQAESYKDVPPYGLDILGAESQAMVGYMLLTALQKALPQKHFVNVVTRSVVNADDPAFDNPTKFIGAVYSKERAFELAKEHHWCVKPDGRYWRRVVPSPEPIEVLEAAAIETLMKAGMTVIAAGGGGGCRGKARVLQFLRKHLSHARRGGSRRRYGRRALRTFSRGMCGARGRDAEFQDARRRGGRFTADGEDVDAGAGGARRRLSAASVFRQRA